MQEIMAKAKKVKCLICDVDGVLTDGSLYLDCDGRELKAFNVLDGMGLKLLLNSGIEVAVITASKLATVEKRMHQLGINHFYTGQADKRAAYNALKEKLSLNDDDFGYVGDDLPDLAIMRQASFAVAVANAVPQVKEFALWETQKSGGRGAVREVCDFIINAQGKLDEALAKYLES